RGPSTSPTASNGATLLGIKTGHPPCGSIAGTPRAGAVKWRRGVVRSGRGFSVCISQPIRSSVMRFFLPLALLLIASTLCAAEPSKLAVPDKEAQEKALSEIKSVLAPDFKLSKNELAKKMLTYARDETDPVRRYVFGVESMKAAIDAGDGTTICETVSF